MSYLPHVADENDLPTLRQIKEAFGFVPNFFRAQTIRPDLIDAEAQLDRSDSDEGRRSYASTEGIHLPGMLSGQPQHLLRDRALRNGPDARDRGSGAGTDRFGSHGGESPDSNESTPQFRGQIKPATDEIEPAATSMHCIRTDTTTSRYWRRC